ncbi:hypothetical protein ACQEVI_24005 [Promicromonospora sp. CA-289599]|uniref:hypothetical protein n=1 Tax=Promicromonospora sp. CA-289599 TaxID=3240014 RepID=UPI003D8A2A16
MAPFITLDSLDLGPEDLAAQLPLWVQLRRVVAGPDRPDYVVCVAVRPIGYSTTLDQLNLAGNQRGQIEDDLVVEETGDGRLTLAVPALVMAARIAGQQAHAGMSGFPVNLAYVLHSDVLRDERLDFGKCLPVGVGFVTDHGELDEARVNALLGGSS